MSSVRIMVRLIQLSCPVNLYLTNNSIFSLKGLFPDSSIMASISTCRCPGKKHKSKIVAYSDFHIDIISAPPMFYTQFFLQHVNLIVSCWIQYTCICKTPHLFNLPECYISINQIWSKWKLLTSRVNVVQFIAVIWFKNDYQPSCLFLLPVNSKIHNFSQMWTI